MLMVPSDVAYMKVICVRKCAPKRRLCALTDALGAPPNLAPLDSPLSAGVRPTLPLAWLSQSDWGWFTRDTLYRVTKRVSQIISGQSTAYVMRW